MVGYIQNIPPAGIARPNIVHTLRRQQIQLGGKDNHQHQSQPEGGHGIRGIGDCGKHRVYETSVPSGAEDSHGSTQQEGNQQRRQTQNHRSHKPFRDHIIDGAVVGDGGSQIALYGIAQIAEILLVQGLVQSPLFLQSSPQDRVVCLLSHQGLDRVTGRTLHQQEVHGEHHQNGENSAEDASDHIFLHGHFLLFVSCPAARALRPPPATRIRLPKDTRSYIAYRILKLDHISTKISTFLPSTTS